MWDLCRPSSYKWAAATVLYEICWQRIAVDGAREECVDVSICFSCNVCRILLPSFKEYVFCLQIADQFKLDVCEIY